MKYFSKEIFKNNKFTKIAIFLIIFFLGIFTERFDFKQKILNFSENLLNSVSDVIYNFSSKEEKLSIEISPKNYQKILESRRKSIEQYRASEDIQKWVSGKINFQDKIYDVKLKLKGVHREHWSHSKKWSYKIKFSGEGSIDGIKRFSIQKPSTRNYLYEWFFMKILQHEGLISHRNKFINTTVNGDNLGVYYFEEMYSDKLIEYNKRRIGPIIGLDKELWIKEANNLKNLGANNLTDSFWRSKVKPIQFKKYKYGTEQEIYLKNAISLFENFRDGKLNINDVFDVNQLAKLMAIKAIFGSVEFDWRDIKFYYNPITSLLEPIGREVHTAETFDINTAWWLNNDYLKKINSDQNHFLKLIFKDLNFYELFLSELNRMVNKNYLQKILENNSDDFNDFKKILELNNPTKTVFSKIYLEKVRKDISDTLNPIQGINAHYLDQNQDMILFSIRNVQSLPVKISAVNFDGNKQFKLKKKIILKGKQHSVAPENILVKVPCEIENLCDNLNLKKLKISYNILGQEDIKIAKVSNFYNLKSVNYKKKQNIDELSKFPFIIIDKDNSEINFKKGKIEIDQLIVIPEDKVVNFSPGTEVLFSNKGSIISYSPLNILGTKENPIIFRSDILNDEKEFGHGLSVINTNKISRIKNVLFKTLAYPNKMSGYGFSGSVNFFNSDVMIENSRFIKNLRGKDYLNIVNSNFEINNVEFIDIKGDAIDIEFSDGNIDNLSIINTTDDALDFSGSNVVLNNILISSVADKAISAGEESRINISNLKIKDTNLGVVSKDLSNVEIRDLEISDTKIGILAYQRKIEYGPSIVKASNVIFKNNTENILPEENSRVFIDNKMIDHVEIDYSIF